MADGSGSGRTPPAADRAPAAALFLGLAALFLMQLLSGRDLSTIPSALIGAAGARNQSAAARRARPARPRQQDLRRQGDAGECLGVVVRALPRGASGAAGAVAGQALRHRRAELQGRAGECAPLPRQPRQSLHRRSARTRTAARRSTGASTVCPRRFLVGRDGKILFKHVGPIDPGTAETEIMPLIEKALAAAP